MEDLRLREVESCSRDTWWMERIGRTTTENLNLRLFGQLLTFAQVHDIHAAFGGSYRSQWPIQGKTANPVR